MIRTFRLGLRTHSGPTNVGSDFHGEAVQDPVGMAATSVLPRL